jgi:hypothetical protein
MDMVISVASAPMLYNETPGPAELGLRESLEMAGGKKGIRRCKEDFKCAAVRLIQLLC